MASILSDGIDIPRAGLCAAIAVSVGMWVACAIPPNPGGERPSGGAGGRSRSGSTNDDRIIGPIFAVFHFESVPFRIVAVGGNLAIIVAHALVAYTYPHIPEGMCPHPRRFALLSNPAMFTWSPQLAAALLAMCAGALIRIAAFRNLGQNFTYHLHKPSGLVTSGVHGYMQHPSYTGLLLAVWSVIWVYLRFDTYLTCFLAVDTQASLVRAQPAIQIATCLLFLAMIWVRVQDEEKMMKAAFGKTYDQWASRTKRFVPGVF